MRPAACTGDQSLYLSLEGQTRLKRTVTLFGEKGFVARMLSTFVMISLLALSVKRAHVHASDTPSHTTLIAPHDSCSLNIAQATEQAC